MLTKQVHPLKLHSFHNAITCTENATDHRNIALGAHLDIEGAFDRTSFDILKQAAKGNGIEPTKYRWICSMLENRYILTTQLEKS
jgi:hypothetical protein